MTAPQTAADAAERVQAFVDARPQDDREGGHIVYTVPDPDRTRGRWLHLTEPDLRALLEERARMAAELEQVRGEQREEYTLCRLGLVSDHPLEQWTGPNANGAAEAAAWRLRATHNANVTVVRRRVTPWREAASAAPDATGDTQTAEQRTDGQRDLTKLEGPQRGSQGDAVDGGDRG